MLIGGVQKVGFFSTSKQHEGNVSELEARANQIITEASDNINNDIASVTFKGFTSVKV